MEGNLSLMLDNVKKSFKSSHFASLLTSDTFRGKVLYQTAMTTFDNRLILLVTGNGLILDRDMARRSIFINLADVNQRRSFRHSNLRTWVKKNLREIVKSVLMLVQAWVAAGMPKVDNVLPSFEAWSQVVGGIIDTTYQDGWAVLMAGRDEEAAQAEDNVDDIGELIEFIANHLPPTRFKSGHVLSKLRSEFNADDILSPEIDSPAKLGSLLHRNKNGIFGEFKLEKKKTGSWYILTKQDKMN